jgi:ABC-type metal ion transport system substrate-binding protein
MWSNFIGQQNVSFARGGTFYNGESPIIVNFVVKRRNEKNRKNVLSLEQAVNIKRIMSLILDEKNRSLQKIKRQKN